MIMVILFIIKMVVSSMELVITLIILFIILIKIQLKNETDKLIIMINLFSMTKKLIKLFIMLSFLLIQPFLLVFLKMS